MISLRSIQHLVVLFIALGLGCSTARCAESADASQVSAVRLTGQRVLILGDSITQDGRYVTLLEYYLHQLSPGQKTDIISIGLSSETVSGLSEKTHPFPRPCVLERVDRALKAVKPKIVLACYGMNDGIYHPSSVERLAAFNTGVHQLITQIRAAGARLILLTPPVFDSTPIRSRTVGADAVEFSYSKPFAGYDEVLAEFSRSLLALRSPDVLVIDIHSAVVSALSARREHNPSFTFTPDGIHPNDEGHLLIAQTILLNLGYNLPPLEIAAIQADPRYARVSEFRQLRSEAWLPFVGYTRGQNFKSASVTAAEQVVSRLQNELVLPNNK